MENKQHDAILGLLQDIGEEMNISQELKDKITNKKNEYKK